MDKKYIRPLPAPMMELMSSGTFLLPVYCDLPNTSFDLLECIYIHIYIDFDHKYLQVHSKSEKKYSQTRSKGTLAK